MTDVKAIQSQDRAKGDYATVTMKDGPVADVPTEIKIHQLKNVISIWFDPTVVKNHFRRITYL